MRACILLMRAETQQSCSSLRSQTLSVSKWVQSQPVRAPAVTAAAAASAAAAAAVRGILSRNHRHGPNHRRLLLGSLGGLWVNSADRLRHLRWRLQGEGVRRKLQVFFFLKSSRCLSGFLPFVCVLKRTKQHRDYHNTCLFSSFVCIIFNTFNVDQV